MKKIIVTLYFTLSHSLFPYHPAGGISTVQSTQGNEKMSLNMGEFVKNTFHIQ